MSTSPNNPTTGSSSRPGRRSRVALWSVVGLTLFLLAGGGVAYYAAQSGDEGVDGEFFTVKRGQLTVKVVGTGTANPLEKVIIRSEVEGRNTIKYLVDQVEVDEGDILVELDSSGLEDQVLNQEISVSNARAALVRAQESLAVTLSQNKSDIAAAELDLTFAKENQTKYTEGEYPQELEKARADIKLAEVELNRAKDKLTHSQKLYDRGFLTKTELEADKLSVTRYELDLKLAEGRLDLLKEYTYSQKVRQLKSDIEQAEMALDRVKRKAKADEVQARADLEAKQTELQRQEERLTKLREQLDKCTIRAPIAGQVVYATTSQGHRRRSSEELEEGSEVSQDQEIIHIPKPGGMKIEVMINESDIQMLRDGIAAGENNLRVRLTPQVSERSYWGELISVDPVANQPSWWSGNARQYESLVHVTSDSEGLSAGMECKAEIIIDQLQDVLYVPIQAVVREGGENVVYVRNGSSLERRVVEIGLNDTTNCRVISGLQAGEQVSLSPPLNRTETPEDADENRIDVSDAPETSSKAKRAPREETSAVELTFEKLKAMSPQQRREAIEGLSRDQRMKFFQGLTAEQRQELRSGMPRREGRGGRSSGRPGGDGRGGRQRPRTNDR